MTVGELKTKLDDYGDHLEITIATPDGNEWETFSVEDASGPDGPCVVLDVETTNYED